MQQLSLTAFAILGCSNFWWQNPASILFCAFLRSLHGRMFQEQLVQSHFAGEEQKLVLYGDTYLFYEAEHLSTPMQAMLVSETASIPPKASRMLSLLGCQHHPMF